MSGQEEYISEEEYEDNQERFEAEVSQWQRYFEEEMGVSTEKAKELMDDNWKPTYNKWLDELDQEIETGGNTKTGRKENGNQGSISYH